MDNAGCYHCATTLAACRVLDGTGIHVQRLDFSASQNGKGPCDRRAAILKSHIKRHLNEGHDIVTGSQLKEAIESAELPDCQVYLCSLDSHSDPKSKSRVKLKDISLLNNFHFTTSGVRMWKAYNTGEGKFLPWNALTSVSLAPLTILKDKSTKKTARSAVGPTANAPSAVEPSTSAPSTVESSTSAPSAVETATNAPSAVTPEDHSSSLFCCPEEACQTSFNTYNELQVHLDFANHQHPVLTSMDRAKLTFAEKVEDRLQSVPVLAADTCELVPAGMGWALKSSQASTRFSEKQRTYLQEKFMEGERTGSKLDGATVSKRMRVAQDSVGGRLFQFNEFLSPQQVTSYFSRLASKRRQGTAADMDTAEDLSVAEGDLPEVIEVITTSLQVTHPIVVRVGDTEVNLCNQYTKGSLSKFCLADLSSICENFDIEVTASGKRKQPYLAALQNFLAVCECH